MAMTMIDWSIVMIVLITIVSVGVLVAKRASKDKSSFFLGGRSMPWWLLGTSMVATTFAADTPNLVTNIVRTDGVAGNWVWWCFLLTGMLTAFVYAKLWRRLGVTTDIEFYERRYSGKSATFLRGFRAVYLGVIFNVLVMANVTLAAIKFGNVLFDISPTSMVLIAGLITVAFSAAGGLLGVLITDMILFVISMLGAVFAAMYALDHPAVGGLDAMIAAPAVMDKMSIMPDFTDPASYIPLALIPFAVQWWSAWYPGAEPGGGGYVAQRMLAAKDERHATAATVFFNFAHYALRPWPWILVALASLLVFPTLGDIQTALPHVDPNHLNHDLAYPAMLTFLPEGLLGLVVASLVAAYISTMSTQLNWGASYLVNDVYARFMKPDATPKQQVMVGRIATAALMALAAFVALQLESALQSFQLMLSIGAGTGLLFFVRWFWTRINAWSEVAAMVLSFSLSLIMQMDMFADWEAWQSLVTSVGLTTVGWIAVTFATSKTDGETLAKFLESRGGSMTDVRKGVISALIAVAGVYGLLFGTGYAIYGDMAMAGICFLVMIVGLTLTYRNIMAIEPGEG